MCGKVSFTDEENKAYYVMENIRPNNCHTRVRVQRKSLEPQEITNYSASSDQSQFTIFFLTFISLFIFESGHPL